MVQLLSDARLDSAVVNENPLAVNRAPHASPLRRVVFAAVAIVLSLTLVDVAVRVLHIGPRPCSPRRIEPGLPLTGVRTGSLESFAYQPNVSFYSIYDAACDKRGYLPADGRIAYRINSSGLRGRDVSVSKPPDVWRVVCLGDSFTFGEGVREEDAYPSRLEKHLDGAVRGKRVEVINAGVQAQGTVDELNWFLIGPSQFQPDVVTLGFFLNDATPQQETIRHHTEWTENFRLSPVGRVSKIWELVERASWARSQAREFLETTRASFTSSQWEDCKRALSAFASEAQGRHFRFIVVIFPVLTQLDATYPFADLHVLVVAACKERGIECVDLLDVFKGHEAASLWVHPTDQHPNEIAHDLAARRIAEALRHP